MEESVVRMFTLEIVIGRGVIGNGRESVLTLV